MKRLLSAACRRYLWVWSCCTSPLGGGKPLLKFSIWNCGVDWNEQQKEREKEDKNLRGVGVRWKRETRRKSSKRVLCFTKLEQNTWRYSSCLSLQTFLSMVLLHSNYCRPAVWTLRRPLVNQGPTMAEFIIGTSWEFQLAYHQSINQQKGDQWCFLLLACWRNMSQEVAREKRRD